MKQLTLEKIKVKSFITVIDLTICKTAKGGQTATYTIYNNNCTTVTIGESNGTECHQGVTVAPCENAN